VYTFLQANTSGGQVLTFQDMLRADSLKWKLGSKETGSVNNRKIKKKIGTDDLHSNGEKSPA